MSQYINLDDDPEVYYYMNFGHSEAYIVTPEAERIDLVRCGECKYFDKDEYCSKNGLSIWDLSWFCADGERRADDE